MVKNRKIIYKLISYAVIIIIFFLLAKQLIDNWYKIKNYDFSFNYYYLLISYLLLFMGLMSQGVVWNKILRAIEPHKRISHRKAIKFFVYSWFGRYIPGKAWMYMARVYLGAKEGISKKALTISVFYEIILSITSSFLFAALLLSLVFGNKFFEFYLIPIIIIAGILILIHPKFFIFLYGYFPKRIKLINLKREDFLNYRSVLKIIICYFVAYALVGGGFFFLVKSIVFLPFRAIVGFTGAFIMASVLGIVALFAPSGLGVREGFLSLFLKFYFPLELSIIIALIARLWATFGELFILTITFLLSKIKKL